jgi:ketosteroid isomerase-like protein
MELIDEYLAALEVGDAKRILALFAPDGMVPHPSTALCPRASSMQSYLPTPPK